MTIQEIYKELQDRGLYPDLYERTIGNETMIVANVEWGDWKHEHRYLDYIMNELGYSLYTEDVTESDGSDCYSALHYYRKYHR